MSDKNHDAERNERRAKQRLGTDNPICCCCGEDDPSCLELHHIAGRKHGDQLAVICRNCHRKLTGAQRPDAKPVASKFPNIANIGRYLEGLGELLAKIANTVHQIGAFLRSFAETGSEAGFGGLHEAFGDVSA